MARLGVPRLLAAQLLASAQQRAGLHSLANVYLLQGKNSDAEELLKRALGFQETGLLGVNHPRVATTLNSLANAYRDQGKYAEAEGLYKRALAVNEKALGVDHPLVANTLINLALPGGRRGDID